MLTVDWLTFANVYAVAVAVPATTDCMQACAGPIRLFFGSKTTVDLSATGEAAFKGQLYQCQLVQAVVLKQVYEARRTQNSFGHLVWMLNEVRVLRDVYSTATTAAHTTAVFK